MEEPPTPPPAAPSQGRKRGQQAPARAGTHGAAEAQEQPKDLVLRDGRVPGHQVDEALQRPPPRLDELPVRCRQSSVTPGLGAPSGGDPALSTRQPRGAGTPRRLREEEQSPLTHPTNAWSGGRGKPGARSSDPTSAHMADAVTSDGEGRATRNSPSSPFTSLPLPLDGTD